MAAADAWRLTMTATAADAPTSARLRVRTPTWATPSGPTLTGSLTLDLPGDGAEADDVAAIAAATPWFTHNALVHYLAPRGLEQFTGGGWGTRDVCQGPVGLLTALDRPDEVADVLLRVFAAQNARGDWPQAFDFLPPVPDHGQQDSHGDVVFWPLLAVGEHLQTTGDAGLLGGTVPVRGRRRSHGTRPASRSTWRGRWAAWRRWRSRAPRCRRTATATGTTPCSPRTPSWPAGWPPPGPRCCRCRRWRRSRPG